jgi:hypothetical protein
MRADVHLHASRIGILDRREAVVDGFIEGELPPDHLIRGKDSVREQPDRGSEILIPDV